MNRRILVIGCGLLLAARPLPAQGTGSQVTDAGDSVTIRLVDVDVRSAVQALARYLDRPVAFGTIAASRVTIETPRPQPLPSAARPAGGVELFVVRLRHARAADVAATVSLLYGRGTALGELQAREALPGRTLGQDLQQNTLPPQSSGTGAAQAGAVLPAGGVGGRSALPSAEFTLVPDRGTNALLIRATRADFELIRDLVKELDVRPLQVLIEVVIAEVRRDRSFQFGVEATVPQTPVNGSSTVRAGGSQAGIGLGDFALRVMNVGGGTDIDATLRASASRGDARILSRPVVIALNNEPAEILVGSQRPFVQVQRSLPTAGPTRDQVVQYKEVGTKLLVRPTISADGYVALTVTQEVNAATSEQQFDAPVISTRSVQTTLLVRDSQTVVLGGLADQQREASQGGLPLLSSIPILGGLFGRASRQSTETEFFLFLTPRIIRSDAEADAVTLPLKAAADKEKP